MKICLRILFLMTLATLIIYLSKHKIIYSIDSFVKDRALYLAQKNYSTWENEWFGVRLLQYPEDLIVLSSVLNSYKPDIIVETGTYMGGTSFFISTLLPYINPNTKIFTVDVRKEGWEMTLKNNQNFSVIFDNIRFYHGSSLSDEFINIVKSEITPTSKVLVILDSDHTADHVYRELTTYSNLLPVGGYILIHDTHLDRLQEYFYKNGGPKLALEKFISNHSNFKRLDTFDHFFLSAMSGGVVQKTN